MPDPVYISQLLAGIEAQPEDLIHVQRGLADYYVALNTVINQGLPCQM